MRAVKPFESRSSTVRMAAETETILVGCGAPKRGMGWFHALQMLNGECPAAELTHVVEPWFLGAGADSPPGEFSQLPSSPLSLSPLLRFALVIFYVVPRAHTLAGAEFAEFKDALVWILDAEEVFKKYRKEIPEGEMLLKRLQGGQWCSNLLKKY